MSWFLTPSALGIFPLPDGGYPVTHSGPPPEPDSEELPAARYEDYLRRCPGRYPPRRHGPVPLVKSDLWQRMVCR